MERLKKYLKPLPWPSRCWRILTTLIWETRIYLEASWNGGTPKWMVYKEQSQTKMDDLEVPPSQEMPTWLLSCLTFKSDSGNRPANHTVDGFAESCSCAGWLIPVSHHLRALATKGRYVKVYQRVNLHFPMVFPWFSYGLTFRPGYLPPSSCALCASAAAMEPWATATKSGGFGDGASGWFHKSVINGGFNGKTMGKP